MNTLLLFVELREYEEERRKQFTTGNDNNDRKNKILKVPKRCIRLYAVMLL
jgi:hypothetical protein